MLCVFETSSLSMKKASSRFLINSSWFPTKSHFLISSLGELIPECTIFAGSSRLEAPVSSGSRFLPVSSSCGCFFGLALELFFPRFKPEIACIMPSSASSSTKSGSCSGAISDSSSPIGSGFCGGANFINQNTQKANASLLV